MSVAGSRSRMASIAPTMNIVGPLERIFVLALKVCRTLTNAKEAAVRSKSPRQG